MNGNNEYNPEIELEEADNTIILTDDEGNETEFEFVDVIEYSGAEYAILLPIEDGEASDEAVILKIESSGEDGEEEVLSGVDDEAILTAVFEIFKTRYNEIFDFEDCDDDCCGDGCECGCDHCGHKE